MAEPGITDHRFLLANERTFLAYVRTALAFQLAGLGVLQFLTESEPAVKYALGLGLVAVGAFVGAAGYQRWHTNDKAIRSGTEISRSPLPAAVTAAVVAIPLLGGVLIAVL